jgi:hypothetical protein
LHTIISPIIGEQPSEHAIRVKFVYGSIVQIIIFRDDVINQNTGPELTRAGAPLHVSRFIATDPSSVLDEQVFGVTTNRNLDKTDLRTIEGRRKIVKHFGVGVVVYECRR